MVEVSRRTLVLDDGTEAYAAPTTFVESEEGYFLAGTPNYVFRGGADDEAVLLGRDSILGAVIPHDGPPHAVPSPLGMHLAILVRAAPRPGGGWDVVFGEREEPAVDGPEAPAMQRVVRLWHGVYDGGWRSLDSLPLPPGVEVEDGRGSHASTLVRSGDRLAWAVGVRVSGALRDDILVLERAGAAGEWKAEVVRTGTGAYPTLAYPDSSSALLLAAVRADTVLRPGESDQNSLFLWTRAGTWSQERLLVRGSEEGHVYRPVFTTREYGAVGLSWASATETGYAVRAIADVGRPDSAFVVLPDLSYPSGFAALALSDGSALWLSRGEGDTVRIARRTARGVLEPAGAILDPFIAPFGAWATPGADVVLTGAVEHPARNRFTTLLVRLRSVCR